MMKNIKIYPSTETEFTNNGLVSITPIKAEVYCDDDYDYYCNIEIPLQFKTPHGKVIDYTPYFVQDNIALVNTKDGLQPFRIGNVEKTARSFASKAYHVFADTKGYVFPTQSTDLYSLSTSGLLYTIKDQTDLTESFTFEVTASDASDYHMVTLGNVAEAYITTNVFEALVYAARLWNAQIVIDKFNILFRDYPAATCSDIVIKNAKNMTDIYVDENWDNVCTKCIAYGYRGLRNSYEAVYASYDRRYDKFISFEPSVSVDSSVDADVIADLLVQATAYVNAHLLPEINYSVRANIDTVVNVGDPIAVKHSRLNVDLITTIISITYNSLTGKYTNIEFGNFKPKIRGYATALSKQIKAIQIRLGQGGL